jgi:hypothetical protein
MSPFPEGTPLRRHLGGVGARAPENESKYLSRARKLALVRQYRFSRPHRTPGAGCFAPASTGG